MYNVNMKNYQYNNLFKNIYDIYKHRVRIKIYQKKKEENNKKNETIQKIKIKIIKLRPKNYICSINH